MKFKGDKKYFYWGVTAFAVIAASILFYFAIFQMDSIKRFLSFIYGILAPLLYGAIISYLLSPTINFSEQKIVVPVCRKFGWKPSIKVKKIIRITEVILAICMMFFIIYGLLALLIPEIINSVSNIVNNFQRYMDNIQGWISRLLKNNPDLEIYVVDWLTRSSEKLELYLTNDLLPQMSGIVRGLSYSMIEVLIFLKNIVIGAMISIYMLYGKEHFIASIKKASYAFFGESHTNHMIRDAQFIHKTFGGFIIGKIIDSAIIGVLCYIGTTLLGTPYALLVSVIIGVTNVIPFFGPFLGAVPCTFLILLINPLQSLYFVIFVVILQQFDGNFLGPKILGDSTGLSSFMVIVAILIGGGFFGVFGMFVGVPVCAVICTIFQNIISNKLKKRKMPTDTQFYTNINHVDEETHKAVLPKPVQIDTRDVFNYRKKNRMQKNTKEKDEES